MNKKGKSYYNHNHKLIQYISTFITSWFQLLWLRPKLLPGFPFVTQFVDFCPRLLIFHVLTVFLKTPLNSFVSEYKAKHFTQDKSILLIESHQSRSVLTKKSVFIALYFKLVLVSSFQHCANFLNLLKQWMSEWMSEWMNESINQSINRSMNK